jgi:hypothetical protein
MPGVETLLSCMWIYTSACGRPMLLCRGILLRCVRCRILISHPVCRGVILSDIRYNPITKHVYLSYISPCADRPIDPGYPTNKQTQPVGGLLKVEFGDCHSMSGIFINSPLHDSYFDKLCENVDTFALPLTHTKSHVGGLSAACTWPYIRQVLVWCPTRCYVINIPSNYQRTVQ